MRPIGICLVVISVISICFAQAAPDAVVPPIQAGQAIISELRLRGPAGAEDEFIELYNNTDQQIVVQSLDGSSGWTVAISNGQITGPACTIPNGTLIPARGHLLCANSNGYSLTAYPSGNPTTTRTLNLAPTVLAPQFANTTPDRTWDFDIPDGSGVALFATTNGTNFTAATRLDAVGFTSSPALFKEGTGFAAVVTANTEHTYYRDLKFLTPKDSDDNAADFRLVGTAPNIQVQYLGAPGPENLNSPTLNSNITSTLFDPSVTASQPPNRERRPTVEPNADLGTLLLRRTFTNNTGQPVSRLRFRVIDITSLGIPPDSCGGCADVRALTSFDEQGNVTVHGVRLEEPPSQAAGGALNSSLSADFINLASPLAPAQSVNIVFKLGVMRSGFFRFYVAIEASQSGAVEVTTSSSKRTPFTAVTGSRVNLEGQTSAPVQESTARSTGLMPSSGWPAGSWQVPMVYVQRNASSPSTSSTRAKRVKSKRVRRARR